MLTIREAGLRRSCSGVGRGEPLRSSADGSNTRPAEIARSDQAKAGTAMLSASPSSPTSMRSVTTYTPAVAHGPSPQKALSPTRIVAIQVRPSSGPPCSSSRRGRESAADPLRYSCLAGVPRPDPVMICLPSGGRRIRRTTCAGCGRPASLSLTPHATPERQRLCPIADVSALALYVSERLSSRRTATGRAPSGRKALSFSRGLRPAGRPEDVEPGLRTGLQARWRSADHGSRWPPDLCLAARRSRRAPTCGHAGPPPHAVPGEDRDLLQGLVPHPPTRRSDGCETALVSSHCCT
jgi:hypothetical protein